MLWVYLSTSSHNVNLSTNLQLSSNVIGINDNFSVSVTVHNTGKVDGKEVVQVSRLRFPYICQCSHLQVYATDLVSSVATPNQQLVGFKKVSLP